MIDPKIEIALAAKESGSQGLQQRRDRRRSYVDVEAFPNALFKGKKDCWFVSKAQVGDSRSYTAKKVNEDGVPFGCDDETLKVKEKDIHKATIRNRYGDHEFSDAFRPRYCSAAFVDLMDRVYRLMPDRSVIVSLVNVIVVNHGMNACLFEIVVELG
ncbi:hypothetical protein OSB04_003134 [Centaurea solstitialis]|uniref:Uncharacterized protein n=1 Tax=Centaurea solstitialis TaxID=347529 RepID=A0AA38U1S8_9ASTR|nr:hypothetical protein OSB04_003134 [Centaurea solstitialis]